ncbi:hypothetical protein RB653_000841 [Dictyostelium firmibasis]|uniref:SNF2-related domain-containing protein n=1 Tax=Dictyostelium firmibasis TaxID=79012 RepID=A0AAN7TXF4_9MYCE
MAPPNVPDIEMGIDKVNNEDDSLNNIYNASKDPNYRKLVNVLAELKSNGVSDSDPKFTTILQITKLYLMNINNKNNTNTNLNNNNNINSNVNNNNNNNDIIELFKAQVESYKYISRNLPIPVEVLQKMSPILENSPHVPSFKEELLNLKYYPKGLIKLDQNNNPITTNTMSYQQLSCNQRMIQQQKERIQQEQQQAQQQEQIRILLQEKQLRQTESLNHLNGSNGNGNNNNNNNNNNEIEPLTKEEELEKENEIQRLKDLQKPIVYKSCIPASVENIKGLPEAIHAINEREMKIQAKVITRIDELKEIPTHFLPTDVRIRSEIESKQLKLLELQRKLRNDVSLEMEDQVLIRSIQNNSKGYDDNDYNLYVRSIPRLISRPIDQTSSIYDSTTTQLPESILVTHKKKFLEAIAIHARDFKVFHSNNEKFLRQNVIKAIHRYHKEKEKREIERLSRERIRLLKARDTEGYRDLLAKTKNERLEMLLGETDSLLSSIHQLMEKEQTEKRARELEEELKQSEQETNENNVNGTTTTTTTTTSTSSSNDAQPIANITSPLQSTTTILAKKSNNLVIEQPDLMTGGKLKEYQVTGLEWLVSLYTRNLNGILADEMGLGKTVQTIAFISFLYERMNVREPFLVVAPLSTISNWVSEFARWSPKLHVIVYKGKQDERRETARTIPRNAFVVVITSFEYIIKDRKTLGRVHWIYIIIDEGHRIKNKNSKLSVQLRQYHSRNRLLLTGTPLQNDLGELWALLNFLLPTIFNSADTFQNWFNAPFQAKGKNLININEEESLIIINRLHQVLRFFLLRRLKSDVESQLPDKKEKVIKCNMSALQIAMYRSLVEYGVLPIDPDSKEGRSGRLKMKGFNNIVKQLQKICNHPYLFKDEWDINEDLIRTSGKFDTMDQILTKMHASKHRVLIFTQMTEVINLMEEYFSLKEWTFLRLDGSTKPEERAHLVVEWNRPDSPFWIFVLSTHAGGLGMNLQTADTVIIFDSDWNPQMDLQAQDRCHRIGQTNSVSVFRLISANSIEEKILGRATDKLEIDAKIIQAGMFNTHSNDQERRAKLEQFLHGFPNNTLDEVPVDLKEINKLIARDDFEFKQFQEMDKERLKIDQANSKKTRQPIKPRLMVEKELPEWVLATPVTDKDEDIAGKKRSTAIASANSFVHDNLTDNQYARMIEKNMTFDEYKAHLDAKKLKNGKSKKDSEKKKKKGRGRGRKNKSDDEESSEDELEDEGISSDDEESVSTQKPIVERRRATPQQRKQQRQQERFQEINSDNEKDEIIQVDDHPTTNGIENNNNNSDNNNNNNNNDNNNNNNNNNKNNDNNNNNNNNSDNNNNDKNNNDKNNNNDDISSNGNQQSNNGETPTPVKKGRGRPRLSNNPIPKRKLDDLKGKSDDSPKSSKKSLMSETEMSDNDQSMDSGNDNGNSSNNNKNNNGEPSENGEENVNVNVNGNGNATATTNGTPVHTPGKRGRKKKIRPNPEDEEKDKDKEKEIENDNHNEKDKDPNSTTTSTTASTSVGTPSTPSGSSSSVLNTPLSPESPFTTRSGRTRFPKNSSTEQ